MCENCEKSILKNPKKIYKNKKKYAKIIFNYIKKAKKKL